jgi:hypothetical protein
MSKKEEKSKNIQKMGIFSSVTGKLIIVKIFYKINACLNNALCIMDIMII